MAYKLRLYMCIFFSGVFKFKQNNLRSFTNIYIYIYTWTRRRVSISDSVLKSSINAPSWWKLETYKEILFSFSFCFSFELCCFVLISYTRQSGHFSLKVTFSVGPTRGCHTSIVCQPLLGNFEKGATSLCGRVRVIERERERERYY